MFRVRRAINSVRPATLPLVVIVDDAGSVLCAGNWMGSAFNSVIPTVTKIYLKADYLEPNRPRQERCGIPSKIATCSTAISLHKV